MKKVIITLLVLLATSFSLFAVTSDTASFMVRAYKVGSSDTEYIEMEVYDALTGTLQNVTAGSTIYLTPYTNHLKTTSTEFSPSSLEPYEDHVIFSFRVSGNGGNSDKGSFTCNIIIDPLTAEVNEKDEYLTAYYELRDVTCVFTTNYKTTGKNGGTTEIKSGATTAIAVEDTSGTLGCSWRVTTSELENWRFQGSVGMAIRENDYSTASKGVYKASVTINLVVNS